MFKIPGYITFSNLRHITEQSDKYQRSGCRILSLVTDSTPNAMELHQKPHILKAISDKQIHMLSHINFVYIKYGKEL